MQSSSISNTIVSISKLSLVFTPPIFRRQGLRDVFVRALASPMESLMRERERVYILKSISLEIRRGDRVGLIGVNGVGKTSLCRCIANIYKPELGTIKVFGKVRAIFDTAIGVFPELTGRENAKLLADFLYAEEILAPEVLEEALEFSELKEFLDVPYKLYSNGMQARLCLSIISCLPTELLILDEVFDGADIFFKEKISKRVKRMIESSGAVIFVSHSPDQVVDVCNRVLLLQAGEIVFDGDPKEGLERYRQQSYK